MGNGRDASRTVLCVDVGNSDTNLGLFVDGELEATWKVTTTERMTADEARMRMAGLFDMLERDGRRAICDDAVIASVVPGLTDAWVTATRALTGRRPLVVGPGVKTGVKMRYNDPGELGADRVADLVTLVMVHSGRMVRLVNIAALLLSCPCSSRFSSEHSR